MAHRVPKPEDDYSAEQKTEIKPRPPEDMRGVLFWPSVIALLSAGGMAVTDAVDTLPRLLFFVAILSLGFGGIVSMFRDMASLTIGKYFKATGLIAVTIFVLIVLLKAVGLLPKM